MSESTYESALSRRRLLQAAGITVATAGASPWLLETASAVAAESKVGGTLDYMSWEGYDSPPALNPWVKAHGVKFKPTYIANHDDIQAKILALHGGKGFDLITYYQGYKELYDNSRSCRRSTRRRSRTSRACCRSSAATTAASGSRTAFAPRCRCTGARSASSTTPRPCPRRRTRTRSSSRRSSRARSPIDDDPVGAYTLAGHTLRINVATMTPAQFATITAYLKKLVKQSKGVAPSYGDCAKRIADGDAVIGWPGWAAQVGFAAGAGNKNVRFVLPKEGGYAFCDSWAIPISCDNPDTAYAYINNAISPKANAAAAIFQGLGGVTVTGAVKYLDKQTQSLYDYNDLNKFFAKAPLYANPPVKSTKYITVEKVIAKWQEVKASA